ncbi:hypothetical protein IFM89_007925 [Coptis chinensis]|uniref:Acid phosphatase/vanadium-dependent haloperoxidase-related protein n=1 Tax=Coptis chinensis TaxID=261450 RepID=A0A835ILX1_9MAGN|nr:hypothetical protein IFM89_007925 [Coptis chinensis]
MLSYHWSTSSPLPQNHSQYTVRKTCYPIKKPNASSFFCLSVGVHDILEITQNKVLVSAAVSAAIGQLSKPFSSSFIYSEDVNFRTVFRAGGFPSTHSAGVVAAATSLGLERGFSDSIFGMAVIFASLVMYDAQSSDLLLEYRPAIGPSELWNRSCFSQLSLLFLELLLQAVRREVGNHAKVLNKEILVKTQNKPIPNGKKDVLVYSKDRISVFIQALASSMPISGEASTSSVNSANPPMYLASEKQPASSLSVDDLGLKETCRPLLEESIGHTVVEVVAGALLGFLVTLAVYSLL